MAKKPRKPTKKELAEKRAKLDRVLAAALAERTDMISLYDIGMWILYACTRSDAISSAREFENDDPEESDHTIAFEIEDAYECTLDDKDAATAHWDDLRALGKQLDPDYEKPARSLRDWLDKPDPESAEILRRVVDNAIDSSRRAARKRVK